MLLDPWYSQTMVGSLVQSNDDNDTMSLAVFDIFDSWVHITYTRRQIIIIKLRIESQLYN